MSSMVGTLKSAFRVPELRKRMIFTLIIVLLY